MKAIDNETQRQVEELLDRLRPSLYSHGGNAHIAEVGEDFVRLELEGACHGCPMSAITFGMVLEEEIKKQLPQIKHVFYE